MKQETTREMINRILKDLCFITMIFATLEKAHEEKEKKDVHKNRR